MEITNRLETARLLIKNLIGSGQAEPAMAARYAVRHTDLPADLIPQLEQFANGLTNRRTQ